MCGRYHFSAELLDEIRDITEQKDWKLELGVLDRDIHPGDTAPVIVAAWKRHLMYRPRQRTPGQLLTRAGAGVCGSAGRNGDIPGRAERGWFLMPGQSRCLKSGCSGTV